MTEYIERLLAEINRLDNQAATVCDLIAPDEPLFSKAGAVRLLCKEAVSLIVGDNAPVNDFKTSPALLSLKKQGCNDDDLAVVDSICRAAKILIDDVMPHTTEWNITSLANLIDPLAARLVEIGVNPDTVAKNVEGLKTVVLAQQTAVFSDMLNSTVDDPLTSKESDDVIDALLNGDNHAN